MESTEPTKMLMRIAEYIDAHKEREELRVWLEEGREEVVSMLMEEKERVKRGKRMRTS